jgi:DNA-binding NarL/FixJ family response regulator
MDSKRFGPSTSTSRNLPSSTISMPKMNGMEVARWLRQATHPTKIVFLTLMRGDDFIREAKRYGHGFVAKSRLNSDLVPALYAAIEGEFFISDLLNLQTET